ncbi:hypothetical protein B0T26DRAFT_637497 [Lasiosphaeria miniovina]|uniref:Oxidoreductase acuF-like C2H2 type zinc-finger domain-containing protein n=1 Tax=Lasiosphaeria miniovina TaxID=1954250 RepID=A0AA40B2Z7_9PEZI|nr:uncharacterized protein B0T26DRAFT_637497 [Lasiosphaeria miniovina]KAK0726730.1 hypothetical protein B0T26DRAFT_637497 [Lasiosphaeria miniovina]
MEHNGWTPDVLEGHIDSTDSTDSIENISEAAKNCYLALDALLNAIPDDTSDQVIQAIPGKEAVKKRDVEQLWGRFEQWAGNLGAMQPRTSPVSLEHRLRNSPAVKEAILGFLLNLYDSTEAATDIISGKRINRTASMLVDSDVDLAEYYISSSDSGSSLSASSAETRDPETSISEIHELMSAIKHAIDSLFKASDFIRKFAPSERRQRASRTSPFDSHADKMYLRDRYPAASRKNEPLVMRLGEANARRRQYFKYRRDHSARLATLPSDEMQFANAPNPESRSLSNHTKPIEGQAPGPSADKSAISKATKLTLFAETEATELVMGNLEAATTFLEPTPSVASFATSIVEQSDDPLSFPPMPQEALDTSSFICSYCHMVVSMKSSKDKNHQWRKHVINDLQPYICTFPTCSLDAFTSQHSWFEHELLKHRNNWRCQICHDPDAPAFGTVEEIHRHITQSHSDVLEKQVADVVEQSRRPLQWIPANDCPLCDENWASADVGKGDGHVIVVDPDQFRKHLGHHLQQIALFSLPRAPPNENAGSNEVIGLLPDQEHVPAAGYKWVREDCGRGWSVIAKKRSTFIAFSAFLKKLEETNRNMPTVDAKDKVSLVRTLYHPQSSPIYSVSISPNRRFLAVGYRTSVAIFDPATSQNHCILYYGPGGETIFENNIYATHYRCLIFTADSKYLVTGGDEGKIMVGSTLVVSSRRYLS